MQKARFRIEVAGEVKSKDNEQQHALLEAYKDGITKHYRNKKWDRFKKYCNEYELIFTSTPEYPSMSQISPISRSFFKLWESMYDFTDMFDLKDEPMRAVFIGEGPGGFVEAFCLHRRNIANDVLFGMTLLSSNKNVPDWKLTQRELKGKEFHIVSGIDATGDLYKIANIDDLVARAGPGTIALVTADGGFDFSGNFSQQEQLSTRLICAEIYTALRLQKPDGTFFLKTYDLRMIPTLVLVRILVRCYRDVHVTKPVTSRAANSEKYLLCSGFRGCDEATLNMLRSTVHTGMLENLTRQAASIGDIMDSLGHINKHFINKQIACIDATLKFIQKFDASHDSDRKKMLDTVSNEQVTRSMSWCDYYDIPISDNFKRASLVGR